VELTKKLLGELWPKLGYREQDSIIRNGVRSVEPDPCNPEVFIINNCFQVAYQNPWYSDGTVLG